jgi:hypothetical protein
MMKCCVVFEVRNKFLNIYTSFGFKGLISNANIISEILLCEQVVTNIQAGYCQLKLLVLISVSVLNASTY